MVIETEKHDRSTFQDVLSDYLDTYGIDIPLSIQEIIVKKFFKPDDVFRPVCAIHYGDYILCIPQKNIIDFRGFLFWDARRQSVRRALLSVCEK